MEIREKNVSDIKIIEVRDKRQNLLFRVSPSHGAKILELNMVKDDGVRPLLWEVDLGELASNDFGKNDILFPFPNRLKDGAYHYAGKKYTFPINEIERHNSIHGFIRDRSFVQKSMRVLRDVVKLDFSHTFHGEPYYPFPFNFEVSYRVQEQTFQISFSIKNTGNTKLPMGLGWHPYFVLNGNENIELPPLKQYRVDEEFIPNGAVKNYGGENFVPDNTFFNATFEILDAKKPCYRIIAQNEIVEIKTTNNFGFLQLYTPPNKHVVALEPMTCCVNCFNNKLGLIELEPFEIFRGEIEIKLLNK